MSDKPEKSDAGQFRVQKNRISDGIRFIGILVTASSIFSFISSHATADFGKIIAITVQLYRNLFYPIFDNSVGHIFSLSNSAKDGTIIYSAGIASMFRAVRSINYDGDDINMKNMLIIYSSTYSKFIYAILWGPMINILLIRRFIVDDIDIPKDQRAAYKEFARISTNAFGLELAYVIVVIVAAVALNAVGALN